MLSKISNLEKLNAIWKLWRKRGDIKVKGYYIEKSEKESDDSIIGNLFIGIANVDELNNLLIKARCEADQLQKTLNQISNFYLQITLNAGKGNYLKVEREDNNA